MISEKDPQKPLEYPHIFFIGKLETKNSVNKKRLD